MVNIILLNNIDSFTYNLVDQLRSKKHQVLIYSNRLSDSVIINVINNIDNPILVLSPGPGSPQNSGCMMSLIKKLRGHIPIIGICLGYQALVQSYGGCISQSSEIFHGRSSLIYHDEQAMFSNIPNPLLVARYHSLIGINIPSNLKINAYYKNHIAMAIRNDLDRICGFQFHPESILTAYGTKLIHQTILWANTLIRTRA
ncbi:glutamine amidotransferase [Candidatus Blochmanniella vafra str. BVAF]|uniref:Aminodeoxychorismate synthase component 2 n=1 Tax=Blochmanniella vafra (strain BVAF) TaxID=859654 RepID=E8Q6C3_BLOVB|nr:gamma-glutamyl-gamma-aminobutyrate hydrolase family protein [Candidatus Blochmannia vafer]ADV33817.1 glutamine amidotransferase [Candidatus Blochmannia vafer str. BVAF]